MQNMTTTKKVKEKHALAFTQLGAYKHLLPLVAEVLETVDKAEKKTHAKLWWLLYETSVNAVTELVNGYNKFHSGDKAAVYNNARSEMSRMQAVIIILTQLNLFKNAAAQEYCLQLDECVRAMNSLIRKMEGTKEGYGMHSPVQNWGGGALNNDCMCNIYLFTKSGCVIMLEDMKIFHKTYEFIRWLHSLLKKFPKSEKYTMAQKIENTALNVLESIIQSNNDFDKKANLQKAIVELDKLRIFFRLSKDLQLVSFRQYEYGCSLINEIGRMLGGWYRSQVKAEDTR